MDVRDTRTKTMSMGVNSTSIVQTLESAVEKSRRMYEINAYLHWYQRFIPGDDMKDLLSQCSDHLSLCADAYREFSS